MNRFEENINITKRLISEKRNTINDLQFEIGCLKSKVNDDIRELLDRNLTIDKFRSMCKDFEKGIITDDIILLKGKYLPKDAEIECMFLNNDGHYEEPSSCNIAFKLNDTHFELDIVPYDAYPYRDYGVMILKCTINEHYPRIFTSYDIDEIKQKCEFFMYYEKTFDKKED